MVNALSLPQADCPNEAALMFPKYGCTGTPHPSVVQTSVLVRQVWVYTINIIRINKNSLGEEGCENHWLFPTKPFDLARLVQGYHSRFSRLDWGCRFESPRYNFKKKNHVQSLHSISMLSSLEIIRDCKGYKGLADSICIQFIIKYLA